LEFKPVPSYIKPHTFSTFIGEEREKKKNALILLFLSKTLKAYAVLAHFCHPSLTSLSGQL